MLSLSMVLNWKFKKKCCQFEYQQLTSESADLKYIFNIPVLHADKYSEENKEKKNRQLCCVQYYWVNIFYSFLNRWDVIRTI